MREKYLKVCLGDVCNLYQPKTISRKDLIENAPYPVYGANGIIGNYSKYNHSKSELLVTCRGASCGNVHLTKPFSWINGNAMVVKPYDNTVVNVHFLSYVLEQKHLTQAVISGSAQPQITRSSLSPVLVPLPSLPEQRAIVTKLEQLFSELDAGVASLQRAQEQLKVYRQAVLKKAFEGELTRAWREQQTDLPTAEELLAQIQAERERYYQEQLAAWKKAVRVWEEEGEVGKKPRKPKKLSLFKKLKVEDLPEIPSSWKWTQSGEYFVYVTSGSRGWAKYYSSTGSIFIRITNLNFDTLEIDLSENKMKYVTPPDNSEGARTKVFEGDFLFSITGYLGMFGIAPALEEAFVNQHICLARPVSNINRKYIGYWIVAKSGGIHYLNLRSKGATKAGLGLDDVQEFPVPLCSLPEQHQIVQEIESRLSVCDQVEKDIVANLQRAKRLRQSILQKAFAGELLTEAELAACRAEADWEPAGVLLERIKKGEKLKREQLK